ncbi:acyl-CoA dehydrogenase [Burkholderia aenigmatica]|uniref:Acyl-CoA dehydrogenase n=1 Tax=Burkholderia aenigmatica TaxID=2015348 RepID=A0A6J5J4K1_9BURK|nr:MULTISPECIES: acyl-CoA dehydrogenase family protein [Burkholderia]AYQ42103.1 acyl-CoA dehydrogenase [Burkholderia lata]CAB3966542.1 acyl-CoA dehydrogenase [Burkholderia aenigmatica]VWC34713.1 acyl-CoA dehydrogenase [Burkholderia aenigmatica]VWC56827.1 acyl-CoA dehydrogenase [Burkholderia aenigmatica]VWC80957.1 acyl-CoA dehydrogenase [Burkholderia aenigmatica]
MTASAKPNHPLPAPDSDFYLIREFLSESDLALMKRVRAFMESRVAPIINTYWADDAFPFELIPEIRDLNIAGIGFEGYGCPGGSTLLDGFIAMELARVDSSISTFYGVHSGLAMGSIYLGGSEEQKQKWLPPMARLEKIGCFGLTEPLVGSGSGGGLLTTAKREGDTWVLNGQKRWIGNSPWCDLSIIWARDVDDNQVKGFIVENKTTPGFSVKKIENKIALRVVQNGVITLDNCRVPEENRLQGDMSFRDTARVLRLTRQYVAWEAVGCSMGAYEHALRYAQTREQFGRPIASFQMIQDHLAKMLGNITASQCMVVRLAELQDQGKLLDQQSSLAKAFCTSRMRETVAWAREIFGGNGIVLDYNVARFFADAEALYSYEGTREMNHLIVGKAITGFSAFV